MNAAGGVPRVVARALKHSGVNLIVTVDCGVGSRREVKFAADMGMDVIVTDHHTPPATPGGGSPSTPGPPGGCGDAGLVG